MHHDENPYILKVIVSILSILLMSSQDSVQKVGQNAARNDLLILQTSLRIFLAPGIGSVQYTYWVRGLTRKLAPNNWKYLTRHLTNTIWNCRNTIWQIAEIRVSALLRIGSLTFLGEEWLARFPSIKAVWSSHGCLGNYQLPKHLFVQFVSQHYLSPLLF